MNNLLFQNFLKSRFRFIFRFIALCHVQHLHLLYAIENRLTSGKKPGFEVAWLYDISMCIEWK